VDILIQALDDCLEKMQSSATIDDVLATYPGLKEELRPLLEAAIAAKSLRFEQPVPISALALSRGKFLNRAEILRNPPHKLTLGGSLRSSAALVYGVIIFSIILLGTGIASAESIPGDIFYPVKLAGEQTQLFLAYNPMTRITLQENYDRQRAVEIDSLMQRERSIDMTFAGYLTLKERNQWTVAGIPVIFPQNMASLTEQMRGKYIEVSGLPQSSGIFLVKDMHTRQFEFTGVISSIQPDQWIVSQMPLTINSDTIVNGLPKIGGAAKFTIIRTDENHLTAIAIQMINGNEQPTTTPTLNSQPMIIEPGSDDGSTNPRATPSTNNGKKSPPEIHDHPQQPTQPDQSIQNKEPAKLPEGPSSQQITPVPTSKESDSVQPKPGDKTEPTKTEIGDQNTTPTPAGSHDSEH
jgi:hypothetical protein